MPSPKRYRRRPPRSSFLRVALTKSVQDMRSHASHEYQLTRLANTTHDDYISVISNLLREYSDSEHLSTTSYSPPLVSSQAELMSTLCREAEAVAPAAARAAIPARVAIATTATTGTALPFLLTTSAVTVTGATKTAEAAGSPTTVSHQVGGPAPNLPEAAFVFFSTAAAKAQATPEPLHHEGKRQGVCCGSCANIHGYSVSFVFQTSIATFFKVG
ncbi:MAG: hypothetical protein J3R72DRAFT_485550 [Linnemannia gamsii]|nr:MAG: hypothetical protein J3R72DRAFT_485550 [Linnemannia gamsii]